MKCLMKNQGGVLRGQTDNEVLCSCSLWMTDAAAKLNAIRFHMHPGVGLFKNLTSATSCQLMILSWFNSLSVQKIKK